MQTRMMAEVERQLSVMEELESVLAANLAHGCGLKSFAAKVPPQDELAEAVGQWVWLEVSPARQPMLAKLLWSFGFHGN